MRFLDCHIHLPDYRGDEVLRYASSTGTKLISAAVDSVTSAKSLELSGAFPGLVVPFVGIHPSEAEKEPEAASIGALVPGAAGVGEIGLDPRYSAVGEGKAQLRVFRQQLEVAEKSRKPVQVHTRGAEPLCLAELAKFDVRPVLLHWFEGEDLLSTAEERGYFISTGPALLYSKKLCRIASRYGEDLILTESDGPVPFGPLGGAAGPMLIPSVVMKLAELKRLTFEEAAERIAANGDSFLGLKGKG